MPLQCEKPPHLAATCLCAPPHAQPAGSQVCQEFCPQILRLMRTHAPLCVQEALQEDLTRNLMLLSGIAQKRGGWACSNFWPVFHKVHICPGYLYTFQRPKKQGCTGGAFCLRDGAKEKIGSTSNDLWVTQIFIRKTWIQVGFLSCNYHTEFEWIELKFALLRPTGFVIFAAG